MSKTRARAGGVAGVLAAVLIAVGLARVPALPGPDDGAQDVFTYFLGEHGEVGRPVGLIALGLVFAVVLFGALRTLLDSRRGRPMAISMLAAAQVGVVLQALSLALIGVLALRPEEADPATARALLDLSNLTGAVSGGAFAVALFTAAVAIRSGPGLLPARFAEGAVLAGLGCLLWTARLFTDASALAADSFLGSTAGWVLLTAWILACGLRLATHRPLGPDSVDTPQAG